MGFKEDLQFRKYTLRVELNIKVYVCNPFQDTICVKELCSENNNVEWLLEKELKGKMSFRIRDFHLAA